MESEENLARYEDLISQQAQAAAVINILGPAAQRRSLSCSDTDGSNLATAVRSEKLADFMLDQPITTHINQILHVRSENGDSNHISDSCTSGEIMGQEMTTPTVVAQPNGQAHQYSKESSSRRRSAANREEKYKCKLCPYVSKWSHGLSNHMRTHNNTVFRCEQCNYSTAWKGDLTNHMRVHTGKMFTCDKCGFQTYRKQGLQKHMRMHSGDKPHKCSLCSYSTCEPGNLKKHMMRHTDEKPISCDLCSYKCRQTTQLKLHVQMHHKEMPTNGSETSAAPTDAAVSPTVGSRAARRSLRKPCSRNRKYTCLFCRVSWMSRRSYTKHMFSKHSSSALYKCGFICERSFLTAAECEEHKATHAVRLPTKCDASTCTSLDDLPGESARNQPEITKSNLPVETCQNTNSHLTDISGYPPDMVDQTLSYHDLSNIHFDCNAVLPDQSNALLANRSVSESSSSMSQSEPGKSPAFCLQSVTANVTASYMNQ